MLCFTLLVQLHTFGAKWLCGTGHHVVT